MGKCRHVGLIGFDNSLEVELLLLSFGPSRLERRVGGGEHLRRKFLLHLERFIIAKLRSNTRRRTDRPAVLRRDFTPDSDYAVTKRWNCRVARRDPKHQIQLCS